MRLRRDFIKHKDWFGYIILDYNGNPIIGTLSDKKKEAIQRFKWTIIGGYTYAWNDLKRKYKVHCLKVILKIPLNKWKNSSKKLTGTTLQRGLLL